MSSSPLSNRKFLGAWLICWAVWCVFHAWILNMQGYTWGMAYTDSLVSNATLALLSLAVSNNLRYYRPGKTRYLYLLAWCVVITTIWLIISISILHAILSRESIYFGMLNNSIAIRFGAGFLINGCIAMLSWMWYNLQEQQENEERKAEMSKLSRDAELFKLRQQLNPHFLFNSLNSISALAGSEPEKARHMIQQLADFLRGSIKKDELQMVRFEEELKQVQLYLEIEKVRFGHRLNDVIEAEENTLDELLPALILQPLVENAIKFGLYDTTGEVTIRISAQESDGELIVKISNPFDTATSAAAKGTGFGLSSVKRRLFLIYGRSGLLETSHEENIFTTTLKIPNLK